MALYRIGDCRVGLHSVGVYSYTSLPCWIVGSVGHR